MIKMVFFDIGDVLFNEDTQHWWLFHTLLLTLRKHGKDVMWDEWDAKRRLLAARGPEPQAAIKASLAAYCTDDTEADRLWREARSVYEEMRRPRPYGLLLDGIMPVLEDLRRDYRLGIIANQHPPVIEGIEGYGIAPLFDVIVIDEIVGVSKPDPAIFEYALGQAGISAHEAIMIGDRPDNDTRPAKALGMGTVRFQRGVHYVHFNPDDPAMRADETVSDVSELAGAIRRVAARAAQSA
jgi:HAD superfamily hydrolase (TIGR01549 family)